MRPRPKLGQHFLRDVRYAERAVEAAELRPTDVVLEVGPGKGVLTRLLAPRCAKVVAVELDEELADGIERSGLSNVDLVRGDAVKVPWPRFDACVSNLPYQISSPFLFKLLENAGGSAAQTPPWRDFRVAVLLVQKEFADRLVAKVDTSDYGRLSVNAQRRAHVEILARVPPGAFDPPPRVDSALVKLTPRPAPFEIVDEPLYERVVEAAFNQRRKKLANALSSFGERARSVPFADQRAGEITPAQFAEVTRHLAQDRP